VRVLAIDQTVEEKNGQRVVVGRTATLELSQLLAEKLMLAHQLGTLSLALRSLVDSGTQQLAQAKPPPRADSITVFRGGSVEAYTCTPNCDHRVIPGGSSSDFNAAPAPDAATPAPAPPPLPPRK
jgi:pilus assembly protein CpaB